MSTADDNNAVSPLWGTVLAVQANFYRVKLGAGEQGSRGAGEQGSRGAGEQGSRGAGGNPKSTSTTAPTSSPSPQSPVPSPQSPVPSPELLCTRRARLKKIGQQVMVGDRVEIAEPDWAGGRGAIAQVLPRETELDRPPIANADQIILVFALAEPDLEPFQLSKFLVKAESTELDVSLCLNKCDLLSLGQQKEWRDRLSVWGYEPIFISVYDGTGLDKLTAKLNNKITVLAGPSGVGKTSLINYLIPGLEQRVGEVSGKLSKGRHTTRHVELFELPKGGYLADTPGFNQPDLDCSPEELTQYFPEIRERLAENYCQFSDCSHRDEPNCAVRGDWERYEHYLEFLEDAIARQEHLNQQSDPDAVMKMKTKRKGGNQFEPRLEAKKYRRTSRKTQQQKLLELYEDTDI